MASVIPVMTGRDRTSPLAERADQVGYENEAWQSSAPKTVSSIEGGGLLFEVVLYT